MEASGLQVEHSPGAQSYQEHAPDHASHYLFTQYTVSALHGGRRRPSISGSHLSGRGASLSEEVLCSTEAESVF